VTYPNSPVGPTPAPTPLKKKGGAKPALLALLSCLALGMVMLVIGAVSSAADKGDAYSTSPTSVDTSGEVAAASAPDETTTTEAPEEATTTAPEPEVPTYGDGTLVVGTDIPPGIYRGNLDGNTCYWVRLSAFDGGANGIIANEITKGPTIVEITASDKGFKSQRCGSWEPLGDPISKNDTAAGVPGGDGTFAVGLDIQPGTYKSSDACYWVRLSAFDGGASGIIANEMSTGPTVVTIAPSDKGFKSQRCGTWTKIG
jgi:hypothetical protein